MFSPNWNLGWNWPIFHVLSGHFLVYIIRWMVFMVIPTYSHVFFPVKLISGQMLCCINLTERIQFSIFGTIWLISLRNCAVTQLLIMYLTLVSVPGSSIFKRISSYQPLGLYITLISITSHSLHVLISH